MRVASAPPIGASPVTSDVEDETNYYRRRIAKERILSESAASDVARSAHRALERFSRDLNQSGFPRGCFSDSECLPGAEAGRHGSCTVT